jgi:TRAP-type C4-dicarboxylate transport system substrate-binding protein
MRNTALALSAISGVLLASAATTATAQTTLTYSNWLPPTHPLRVNVIDPWLESFDEATDGSVVVETLPATVGTVPGQFDVARDGVADLVFIINGYTPGRLDLQRIAELPFLGNSAQAVSIAYWRTYQDHLADYSGFDGVVPLAVFTHGPGAIYLRDGIVDEVSDLDGARLRVGSETVASIVEALGGVPVQTPLTEIYEVMSTGVVDGTLMNLEAANSFNLTEVLEYATRIDGGIYNLSMSLLINEASWNALSADEREAIMGISGEGLVSELGRWQDRNDQSAIEALEEAGAEVAFAPESVVAEMQEMVAPVEQSWIDIANERGLPDPAGVLEAFRAEIAEVQANLDN